MGGSSSRPTGKRVLLTGGTGFIGANLARRLVADGHRVHLLVHPRHTTWRLDGLRSHVRLHAVALDDPTLDAVVRRVRPEWVFHLATHGAYSWQTDVDRIVATNVVGTTHLVRACVRAGIEAFVNTGSSSEYGPKDHAPHEDEAVDPNSYYAVAKVAATLFCRHTAQREGIRMPTLRLYSVYGPWEEPHRLMPSLIVHGLDGGLPPLVDPTVARDFVYVDDVVDAFLRAAATPDQPLGAVYNVGSGVQTTLRDAVAAARRVLGVAAEPVWGSMPNRAWDTSVWCADVTAIRRTLGWQPTCDLTDGLRRMTAWLSQQPRRVAWYREALAQVAGAREGAARERSAAGRR